MTDTPLREVRVGVELLRAAGLRAPGASVTSCPTCGRLVPLFHSARQFAVPHRSHLHGAVGS